jgi:hypothetical protein
LRKSGPEIIPQNLPGNKFDAAFKALNAALQTLKHVQKEFIFVIWVHRLCQSSQISYRIASQSARAQS